ncbi:MAG: class I SAM-dependent DNA methyltransferase [Candidatus Krumholzibacteriia bacterium]
MNPSEFTKKWGDSTLKERSGYQEHFIDLCRLVEHPTPGELDPTGASFCFERGAAKVEGGQGWADAWKRGFFGLEYKGKNKDLEAAYRQLLQYREALDNPPLLVVCDFNRIIIHTNFTNTPSEVYEVTFQSLKTERGLSILRAMFHDPEKLRPGITSQTITAQAAGKIALIARSLRERGEDPHAVARFMDRLVFCMFAEDIGLLPRGLFTKILEKCHSDPERFTKLAADLFQAMATGGDFGMDEIQHFNGALFEDATVQELNTDELTVLYEAAQLEWDAVDPSIFGTLFERGLDPGKRTQLGAHYTSRADIVTIVEPVVIEPLRREWEGVKGEAITALAKVAAEYGDGKKQLTDATRKKHQVRASAVVSRFLGRLSRVKVLDPACGSGNFLYVSLQLLKDFEKEIILWAHDHGLEAPLPVIHPKQLFGIEINPYAFDLAQMTVWIGHLQWVRANGFGSPPQPILQALPDNFRNMDAIVASASAGDESEPEWPAVDFIVSNPPFLGGKLLRASLGDAYVDQMFAVWKGRVAAESDLCCYWFEKARAHIAAGKCKRAGLLATQGIRGGANREVLKRIKESGDIFFAESDRHWVLDGAHVHISMVGFDDGTDGSRVLDGKHVSTINANLTSTVDITQAVPLKENAGIAFMGDTKGGAFDLPEDDALAMLVAPNPHGRPNSDVLVPWVNGMDVMRRPRGMWILDYGTACSETGAAQYEAPFGHILRDVKPVREGNKRKAYRDNYWLHVEPRPALRRAISGLSRFLATPTVSKFRTFVWMTAPTLPDHQLIAFARSDNYFFGVLQARFHEVWARAQASQLREAESGTRYTPTSCFDTFPLPYSPGKEEFRSASIEAVAGAAATLFELRKRWLNPPEWTKEVEIRFPATPGGPWDRQIEDPAAELPQAVYRSIAPLDAKAAVALKKRTLTALYNEMPRWLFDAHRNLDEAVAAAYNDAAGGVFLTADAGDEQVLEYLLELNQARSR